MNTNKIKITESELRNIISETIQQTMIEEGFWDNMKSAWQGAKQGYKTQQTLDRGTEGFKQQHDHEDAMAAMDPLTRPENTAEEQSSEIYKQYQFHQAKANQLLALYKKLNKQYGLVKQGVGKYVNPNKIPMGAGVDKRQGGILANTNRRKMPRVQGGFGANQ